MRVSVIITNYNYGSYLKECLQSVLRQTRRVDEIVVVDDGSTDDSAEVLRVVTAGKRQVNVVLQENQGHLAALERGVSEATGDVLFLLDADDRYLEHHVASVCEVLEQNAKVDLVCTGYRHIGNAEGDVFRRRASGMLGCAAIAAVERRLWVAGQTSVLAFRRSLADEIFPYPVSWRRHRVQTGEVGVVFGASLLGARQYYLRDVQVEYRVHGANFDANRKHDRETSYRISRLCHEVVEYYREKAGLPRDFSREALAEFLTWEHPGEDEWRCYRSIILSAPMPWGRKLEHCWRAYRHYVRSL